jgi:hypothetical protein
MLRTVKLPNEPSPIFEHPQSSLWASQSMLQSGFQPGSRPSETATPTATRFPAKPRATPPRHSHPHAKNCPKYCTLLTARATIHALS